MPSLRKRRCADWASRWFARWTGRRPCVSPHPVTPLGSRPFDLILMDLKMPGLDGYEATRRLRRLEAACGRSPTPIVALTANALEESRRSCMAAGFDAFLVKPVEFRTLAGAVEKVCTATEATSSRAAASVMKSSGAIFRRARAAGDEPWRRDRDRGGGLVEGHWRLGATFSPEPVVDRASARPIFSWSSRSRTSRSASLTVSGRSGRAAARLLRRRRQARFKPMQGRFGLSDLAGGRGWRSGS